MTEILTILLYLYNALIIFLGISVDGLYLHHESIYNDDNQSMEYLLPTRSLIVIYIFRM